MGTGEMFKNEDAARLTIKFILLFLFTKKEK
jgi:hypothetical protein